MRSFFQLEARVTGLAVLLLCLPIACGDDKDSKADGTDATNPPDVAPDGDTGDDAEDVDTATDVGPDVGPDTTPEVEVIDTKPGLGIDYGATAAGAMPRWESGAEDWMAIGWPSDRYLKDGHVKLDNMPQDVATLLKTYMTFGEDVLNGWGLNGSIYFEFQGTLDVATLPDAKASTAADAMIQLVDVTKSSAAYGARLPLVYEFYDTGDDPFYSPHTLAIRPVYGFPLVEGDTYCAIVTRAVKDAAGNYLQQAPELAVGFGTEASLAPLIAWLDDSPLARRDIAVATCFTAQDATGELDKVARWIDVMVPPEVDTIFEPGVWGEFHGLYTAPNFQAGTKPYQSEAGDIRFDDNGDPIVQADEEIRFLLLTPTDHEMPADGWPVTLYAHGTGGDYESCRGDTRELVLDGIAVLCIDQPLHGSRGPDGALLSDIELVLFSFNFVNPYAGRSSFRQAAIDTILLSRMIEAGRFDLDGDATLSRKKLALDPEKIFFFGHSHGGLSGTLALAVDARLKAGVISGMSGVIIETILRRKDPADLATLAANLLRIKVADLDSFHPALNLMQMLVDATDPINYTRYWVSPRSAVPAKSVFVTQGTVDAASPSIGNDAATAAGGVPQVRPLAKASEAHLLRGIEPLDLPVKGNIDLGNGEAVTVVMRAWQGGTHFVAFDAPDARAMWRHFLYTAAYGDGPPELSTGDVVVTRQEPVSAADVCADAREIPTGAGFPIQVRGNSQTATPDFTSQDCGADVAPLGAVGRDVYYRFTATVEATYRFRIALQPATDRDHPRFGPDLLSLLQGCGQTCFARKADGAIDITLGIDQSVIVVVDGTTSADVGAYSLIVEQRCLVLECDERECGNYGCGNCGTCAADKACNADGKCVARSVGDTCASAIPADSVPFLWSGDTRPYLNDAYYVTGQCPDFPFTLGFGSDDLVFQFTPPTSGTFVARLDGDYDTNLWVADTCATPGPSCLEANRTGFRDARVLIDGTAGEPVFVFVDGASNSGNSAGHATLQIDACVPDCVGKPCGDNGCGGTCGTCPDNGSCVTVPGKCAIPDDCPVTRECKSIPGDLCESAFVVATLPFSQAQSTANFQSDYGVVGSRCEPQADGSNTPDTWGFSAADVAYAFTAPKAGLYRFGLDTGNPVFDASLYVTRDCSDIDAGCIGADERDRNERVWVDLDKDETVYAIVDGWVNFGAQSGKYTIDVNECVATCENRQCGSDGCIGSCGECGDGFTCQDNRCLTPPGELCPNPRGVGRLPWTETVTTADYGSDRDTACDGAPTGAASPDVSYRFEAPEDGTYRFIARADFSAQVYFDGGCDENRCLASGLIPAVHAPAEYRVDRTMVKGEAVLVTIDGVDTFADTEAVAVSGSVTFSVAVACDPQCEGKNCGADGCGGTCGTCEFPSDLCGADQLCFDPEAVPGNTCALPFAVGALPFSGTGDTSKAWDDSVLDEGQCSGFVAKGMGSADEVWQLTAGEAGDYEIVITPEGWDSVVYVLGDCADPVGTCLGADDGQLGETLNLTLGAGENVFIVVDGEDNVINDVGAYRIDVRRVP